MQGPTEAQADGTLVAWDRVTYIQVAAAPGVEDCAEAGGRAAAQAGQGGAVPFGHARATAVQQWLRSTKVAHAAPDIRAHAAKAV